MVKVVRKKRYSPCAIVLFDSKLFSLNDMANHLNSITGMSLHQCIQCALIVKCVGKYEILSGRYSDIADIAYSLDEVGLDVKIQYK